MQSTGSQIIESSELLNWLPHRYPFLFVDRVTALTPNESAQAVKSVTANEPFFPGHFPGNPVMPGVVMLEALAQLCCVLAFKSKGSYKGEPVYLMGFNDTRFRRVVRPGDTLLLSAKVQKVKRNIWVFACEARVGDELAVETEIMAGIGQ